MSVGHDNLREEREGGGRKRGREREKEREGGRAHILDQSNTIYSSLLSRVILQTKQLLIFFQAELNLIAMGV